MSENNDTVKTSTISPSIPGDTIYSGENSPIKATATATAAAAAEEHNTEDLNTLRESKRRKNCPTALEKIYEPAPSNRWFSFSFDTKLKGSTPEVTPKFGSFNLGRDSGPEGAAETAAEEDGLCQIPAIKEAAEEEGGGEVSKESEVIVALSSVD